MKIKQNVTAFNNDVDKNQGYLYTTNAKYSSVVSNKRMTDEVNKTIASNIKTIIDIGCGDGTYTNEIIKSHKNIKITGIDPSNNAIDIAKSRFKDIQFLHLNIYDIDSLLKSRFDLTIFRGVLHHISNQSLAIHNASLISDNLLIIEPNGNNFILKLIEKKSQYHIDHEEQSFSTKSLTQTCLENNWEITSIKYIGFVPFFFPTLPSKIIYFFQPFLEKIPFLNKYFCAQIVISCKNKK